MIAGGGSLFDNSLALAVSSSVLLLLSLLLPFSFLSETALNSAWVGTFSSGYSSPGAGTSSPGREAVVGAWVERPVEAPVAETLGGRSRVTVTGSILSTGNLVPL